VSSRDDHGARPSQAALEARRLAIAKQERDQKQLLDEGRAALRKIRSADRAEAGEEDRITLADLRDALEETRRQPQSMPVKNPVDLAMKAGRKAIDSLDHVPPDRRWMIWMFVGAVILAAWLGWLTPPPRPLPKSDVAAEPATT
jgi:hypothetical protein